MPFMLGNDGMGEIRMNTHMTEDKVEEIVCPKCGKKHTVKKYTRINVTEKPELREKILKNEIFKFQCDDCDYVGPLTYETMYCDSKHKLFIYMAPEITDETKQKLRQMDLPAGADKRLVDNINDLKEKIIIRQKQLDDRVVEMCKVMYIGQLQDMMVNDTLLNILFDYDSNGPCFIVFFQHKGVGKIPLKQDFYDKIEKQYRAGILDKSVDDFMKVDMEWSGNLMFRRN